MEDTRSANVYRYLCAPAEPFSFRLCSAACIATYCAYMRPLPTVFCSTTLSVPRIFLLRGWIHSCLPVSDEPRSVMTSQKAHPSFQGCAGLLNCLFFMALHLKLLRGEQHTGRSSLPHVQPVCRRGDYADLVNKNKCYQISLDPKICDSMGILLVHAAQNPLGQIQWRYVSRSSSDHTRTLAN